MLDTPYIVLDTETTGLDPDKGARLIEVAAARWYKGACVGRFSCLVKQDEAAYVNSARALKKNGLSREFVEGAGVSRLAAYRGLHVFTEDAAFVVAHNAGFDQAFVAVEAEVAGQRETLRGIPWVCTQALAWGRFGQRALSLKAAAAALDIEQLASHRAAADVHVTGHVFLRLVTDGGYTTVAGLVERSDRGRVEVRAHFGRSR